MHETWILVEEQDHIERDQQPQQHAELSEQRQAEPSEVKSELEQRMEQVRELMQQQQQRDQRRGPLPGQRGAPGPGPGTEQSGGTAPAPQHAAVVIQQQGDPGLRGPLSQLLEKMMQEKLQRNTEVQERRRLRRRMKRVTMQHCQQLRSLERACSRQQKQLPQQPRLDASGVLTSEPVHLSQQLQQQPQPRQEMHQQPRSEQEVQQGIEIASQAAGGQRTGRVRQVLIGLDMMERERQLVHRAVGQAVRDFDQKDWEALRLRERKDSTQQLGDAVSKTDSSVESQSTSQQQQQQQSKDAREGEQIKPQQAQDKMQHDQQQQQQHVLKASQHPQPQDSDVSSQQPQLPPPLDQHQHLSDQASDQRPQPSSPDAPKSELPSSSSIHPTASTDPTDPPQKQGPGVLGMCPVSSDRKSRQEPRFPPVRRQKQLPPLGNSSSGDMPDGDEKGRK